MIHVSSEFKEIMMQRQDFKENAEVTFSDGTVLHLEEKDFSITNNSVVDSADANAVPIGAAICRNIQMELLNEDDHLEKYDFYGARIRLYLTFQLSDTIEKIEFGTFTVTAPECYGTTVVVNASDDMYKANVAYSTDLPFPATAGAVLRDACSRCSILMRTTSFLHDDFQIQTKPSGDYTFRQVIGYLAMIACGNARINRSGKLEILTYDLDFTRECHNLTEWKSLTMDTSDITITGIQTTRKVKKTEGEKETEVEETVRAGSEGYMLTVSNPLVSGNEETLVSWIHEKISGVPFRRFTGDYITYPLAEFMDLAKITDWRGNSYHTFVTDVNFVFFGITTLKNSAESGMRNASKYGSEDTQTNVHLQELIEQERTDRQEAIKNLGDSLNAGGGLYATYEKQPDGSTITYLHDKPTLKESKTVIKITAEAIGVSNDGGKNYLYGFVLDGDIIARILYAHGIDADYINTGAIIVRDAETKEIIFSVDMDAGRVVISGDIIQIGNKKLDVILNDLDERIKKAGNIVMQLDNEYQGIPADWQGNIASFPTVQTTVQVFYGQQDVSASCSYSTNKSSGITGRWDNMRRTYTVTGLSTDTGWVDITSNYLGIFNVTKRFNVSKNKDGKPGEDGQEGRPGQDGKPGRTYFIELSLQALKRGQDGLLTPDEITVHGYYRDGDSSDRHDCVGRFQLQASSDGKTYTTVSSSSTDTSGQRFTQLNTVSKNYIFFRVNFYHPGGFTDLIDYQTIPVLIDIAALSKDDILDLITDHGKWQGFYKGPDGHIYISFEAARGGLMKLGGVNNGNGRQEIYDNRGNLIGRLDNTGLTFYYKYSQQGQGYSYTGITLNKDGLIYVEGSYTGGVYIDTVYEYVLSFDSTQTGVDGDFKNLDAAKATIASAVLNNITKMLVSGDATFSSKPKFNNGLNVADGNVQFPGWKFNGRFLESTDGHVKIRDKDGIARLESGNFQIMYGLDLHLAGQSGSGDFGDGGSPFNIYGLGTAVGSNLVINGNSVYRSSSSKRYKTIGRNVSEEDIEKWYQIHPVWAKYKNDYVNRNSSCFNKAMPMLIAEDVETYLPTAAVKNEEGLTDDWSERILIPAMFAMIKSQKEQIDAMKKEIEEIKRLQNNQEVRKK